MERYRSVLRIIPAVVGVVVLGVFAGGCATWETGDDPRLFRDLDNEGGFVSESGFSYWKPVAGNGELRVTVDLSDQAAYFFRGDVPVGRSRVATGRRGHRTPTGSFVILEKQADKSSNLYGRIYDRSGSVVVRDADTRKHAVPPGGRYVGAPMPYWMRLTDSGIGMHAGPIPRPGRPASHGCIRMPREMARIVFANVEVGTPVKVVR